MDEADKGRLMTTIGVSWRMFLLVPAHSGCTGQNPESHTKFEVSTLSHSTDILGGRKISNGSHVVISHTPFRNTLSSVGWDLL